MNLSVSAVSMAEEEEYSCDESEKCEGDCDADCGFGSRGE
jgi:hypothetical protein